MIHDLRRTAASGLARNGVPIHVTEKALNHVSGEAGGLVGVYQRYAFPGLNWRNYTNETAATMHEMRQAGVDSSY